MEALLPVLDGRPSRPVGYFDVPMLKLFCTSPDSILVLMRRWTLGHHHAEMDTGGHHPNGLSGATSNRRFDHNQHYLAFDFLYDDATVDQ